MYLKQVELENFKSFGGKTTIPLMEGYMAVTGPNGSGKSNIGDAILFVLGPKSSKAVRAGRLTDLIFDGGQSKTKAKSMTVSLVFDNSDRMMPWDADEVRLTRYIKLAGNGTDYSSYFYINGQKSSLSEFDTLLTKARISADGYNLVQQGDVTRIVEMGAIERRRVLDGISGIASFDADIQKAQSERAEADGNLGGIRIIEGEKARRLKALEKDKQEAEVYLKAKQDSEVANAQLRVRLRDNRVAALESIEGYIARIDGEVKEATDAKAAAITQKAANEKDITALEDEIERQAGPEYRKVKNDVEAAKVAVSTEKDRMEQADLDKERQVGFRSRFEEQLEDNAKAAKDQTDDLSDLSARRDEAAAAKEAADAEEARISAETSRHGGEITELQTRIAALDREIDEAGGKDQGLQADAAAKSAVVAEAERAVADAEEAVESARFAVKDAEWNLSEVKKAVGPVTDVGELGNKVLELKKKEAGYEKQEAELRRIAEARADEFNRLSAEKRVSESLNSRNAAVNAILSMKESGDIRGIHGTISQLATVEKGWETALSVAAGNKMSAVVVDDDAVAAQCISYLRENKLGRVTFLPLNKMLPGKPRAKAIMAVKSTRGYATDMIDFDPRYTNAFWYVFGDTMLVDGMDQARSIMGGVRLVTRAGDLVEASGAMVGGTVNTKAIPKFGASSQSELDKAANAKREADDALAGVLERLRGVRDEIRAADDAMREANASGAEARGKIAEAEAASKSAKRDLDNAKQALADRQGALSDARKASEEAVRAAAESQKALEGLRDQRSKARARMQEIAPADLQERIQKARDAVYSANKELSDLESQIGGVRAEIAGLEKQREAIEAQIAEVDKAIKKDEEDSAAHAAALEERRKDLAAVKDIEEKMESGLEELRSKRDALVQRRYSLDSEIEKAQTAVETKNSIRLSQVAQAKQARADIAVLEEEIAKSPVEAPQPIPSEEALRTAIKECQRRMDAVGNVNLRALEDYDSTKAELDALHDQMSRLEKQIKGLDDLTEDLTSKKKGLFMKAYEAVDANFKSIYAELSGGGQGYMALDDPDDPFSGGLQINAKPRNGKLLRLEALSGGEKSLTALSFIFAIQDYQPSPFYMLDEVDMFLDAVNAEMVAKRVKVSSAKAQFIQVSLRKVTLTQADHLIGVTRPPSGVSRVIMQPDLAEVSKYEEEALRRQREAGEGRRARRDERWKRNRENRWRAWSSTCCTTRRLRRTRRPSAGSTGTWRS